MAGRIQLLCGPSGGGKTSSLEVGVRSYRWTTRDPRKDELLGVDGGRYALDDACALRDSLGAFRSMSGTFVTEDYFLSHLEREPLIAVHRYPDALTGNFYGFPLLEMRRALQEGGTIAENIAASAPLETLLRAFEGFEVESHLFLASYGEIRKRLAGRPGGIDEDRDRLNRTEIREFLHRLDLFTHVDIPVTANQFDEVALGAYLDGVRSYLVDSSSAAPEYDFPDGFIAKICAAVRNDCLPLVAVEEIFNERIALSRERTPLSLYRSFPCSSSEPLHPYWIYAAKFGHANPELALPLTVFTILDELGDCSAARDVLCSFPDIYNRVLLSDATTTALFERIVRIDVGNKLHEKFTRLASCDTISSIPSILATETIPGIREYASKVLSCTLAHPVFVQLAEDPFKACLASQCAVSPSQPSIDEQISALHPGIFYFADGLNSLNALFLENVPLPGDHLVRALRQRDGFQVQMLERVATDVPTAYEMVQLVWSSPEKLYAIAKGQELTLFFQSLRLQRDSPGAFIAEANTLDFLCRATLLPSVIGHYPEPLAEVLLSLGASYVCAARDVFEHHLSRPLVPATPLSDSYPFCFGETALRERIAAFRIDSFPEAVHALWTGTERLMASLVQPIVRDAVDAWTMPTVRTAHLLPISNIMGHLRSAAASLERRGLDYLSPEQFALARQFP